MKYLPHSILKRRARSLSKAAGIKHTKALENLAKQHRFADNYEMAKVAEREPFEARLMEAAFGVVFFEDVIYSDPVYGDFLSFLDDFMAGAIAETNAEAFEVEDLAVVRYDYDPDFGCLSLNLSFQYTGDQHPDKPWCGNIFYFHSAELKLLWRSEAWQISDDSPFEVFEFETDRDRDYRQQLAEGSL